MTRGGEFWEVVLLGVCEDFFACVGLLFFVLFFFFKLRIILHVLD